MLPANPKLESVPEFSPAWARPGLGGAAGRASIGSAGRERPQPPLTLGSLARPVPGLSSAGSQGGPVEALAKRDGPSLAGHAPIPVPIKVLHVLGSLDRGGVETWLLDLLPELDWSQWQFDFCTVGPACGRYAAVARAHSSQVIHCPLGAARGPAAAWSFALRFYRILRGGGYQFVHSHVHHFSSLVLAVARAAGVPARVAHSHNTGDGEADTWCRSLYRSVSGALLRHTATLNLGCSSEAARALFGPRTVQDRRVSIVPYGLGEAFFGGPDCEGAAADAGSDRSPRLLRSSLRLEEGAAVVGHVGRFERQKNHDFLLEVVAAAKSARPPLRWLLVGDGPRRLQIERQAASRGLRHLVTFCGLREDVPQLMSGAMDAFVLPSLHEGLPLVLLEAQASGLRSLVSAAVTREAAVMEDAVEYLPLSAGPSAWAERLAALAARGRCPAAAARSRMEAGGFTIAASLTGLLESYYAAMEKRPHAHGKACSKEWRSITDG